MFYRLGRLLQFLGLLLLPLGIAGNLAREDQVDLRTSLTIAGLGLGVFVVGYLLQQVGKKS